VVVVAAARWGLEAVRAHVRRVRVQVRPVPLPAVGHGRGPPRALRARRRVIGVPLTRWEPRAWRRCPPRHALSCWAFRRARAGRWSYRTRETGWSPCLRCWRRCPEMRPLPRRLVEPTKGAPQMPRWPRPHRAATTTRLGSCAVEPIRSWARQATAAPRSAPLQRTERATPRAVTRRVRTPAEAEQSARQSGGRADQQA
jgi:hypothetical protein